MEAEPRSTRIPQLRRTKRRDWVRLVCLVLCCVLGFVGLVPVVLGGLVRTRWVRSIATRETSALAVQYGVHASYDVDVRLWPLSVAVRDIQVEASDGGSPLLVAKALSVRPKIFALMSGKIAIDQIELVRPVARVVLKDGKLANLDLKLPPSEPKKDTKPTRPPFDVVSVTEAAIDLTIDETHVTARDLDADLTTDDDGQGGAAYEIAVRLVEAHGSMRRALKPDPDKPLLPPFAIDDDTLCALDGRVRIEPKRILVRRLSLHGAADMDPAPGTGLPCNLPKTDYRYVDVALGHLAVSIPQKDGDLPNVAGHVKARAPLPLIARTGGGPYTEGWAGVDLEARYSPETPLPDVSGRFEAHDLRVARFNFAHVLNGELVVQRGVVSVPLIALDIASSKTEIRDVEVRPLEPGIPIKVGKVDILHADFTQMLHDFHVHPRPFVGWDIRELHVRNVAGTGDPLKIDGELSGKTFDFVVNDKPVIDPNRRRVIGVKEAALDGKLAVRPKGFEFQHMTVTTPRSIAREVTVGIGYHEELSVDVPSATVDIGDVAPLGSVNMAGVVDAKVNIKGTAGEPVLVGDISGIKDFVIGDIPFGNITNAHVRADIDKVLVDISDVRAQKGKSTYEMPTGRLDFSAPADMVLDGQIATKNLDIRDFFSVFHLDDDPRFLEIGGVIEAGARMHLALGGPEDRCGGGFLTVAASATARDVNLLGEKFDEAHADLEYRWLDQSAGIEGAEIDIRSIALAKVKKPGRPAIGTILGALNVARGGEMHGSLVAQGYPLARVDLLGEPAKMLEGSASGVVQVGGKISAFDVNADVNLTPVRIKGAPFGGSDLHVGMTQRGKPDRAIGRTACGAPITAPFDKNAFLKDTSSGFEYRVAGALFGGQVRLDDIVLGQQSVLTGKVALERFDLGPIGKIITPKTEGVEPVALGGEVTGELALERVPLTDLQRARVTFAPRTMRVVRGGQKVELRDRNAILRIANDRLDIPKVVFDLATPNGLEGSFDVHGAITQLTRGGKLDLEAELSPLDLGILVGVVPKISRAAGKLAGSIKVAGTPSAPEFDGKLAVRGGELAVSGLPGGITDVEIDVEADENEISIKRGVGHFLGGDVNVTGQMPIKGGQLGIARATVTGRQMSLTPIDGVRASADADLEVTLNTNATTAQGRLPFVSGEIEITSFEYSRPVTVDLTGFKGGPKRTVVDSYDPTADAIAFGIDVRARTPLVIKNNLVDAKLGIDPHGIRVTGTNQRVGLRGELMTLPGGRFRVFANDFELQKGYIRFDDPTRIAPHVDITGVTEYRRYTSTVASGDSLSTTPSTGSSVTNYNVSSGGRGGGLWRITLHAFGDTEDLRVDMTSDPVLSREDIFFLLTIGLTRAEVDQVRAGSVYASAAFEAIGTVSGADRAVKQAIPIIDDFRFGSAYSPRTGRTEPQVTIGRRLTDNVRANVSTGLTEDRQLRSIVEWRLSRPLRVEASYDNISTVSSGSVGNFGLDFRWRVEFQ